MAREPRYLTPPPRLVRCEGDRAQAITHPVLEEPMTAERFKPGDHVSWNSEAGVVRGRTLTSLRRPRNQGLGRAPVRPMTTAIEDPSELPVVLVDERTRMADLVAADGQPGRMIDVGQARHAAPAQDGADGRRRVTEERSKAIRTVPGGSHLSTMSLRTTARATMGFRVASAAARMTLGNDRSPLGCHRAAEEERTPSESPASSQERAGPPAQG
jgi:hypothetical protein